MTKLNRGIDSAPGAPYRPRKLPQQKRSQILFKRILMAAKELFEREGYAYVSTNQIADHANVSIGSIYQYFSNCESIALALYEEASTQASLEMRRKAFEILSLPLRESIPRLIGTLADIFEADQFVLLQLIDEVPELRIPAQAVSFDNLIHSSVHTYLRQHYPDVDESQIARKVYVLEKSVNGTIRRYLEERPDHISREAIIEETSLMLQRYLETLGD
ncbi:MAG: TetR/AcrR family transcriptional regulator [Porticoccaceae bacterium]